MILHRLSALAASLLFAAAATAQGVTLGGIAADPGAPVEVTSDTLSVDQASGTAVFSGNVVIGQGDLRLAAAEVVVIYGEAANEIARLDASGGVTFVTPEEAAEADRAIYDIENGTMTLTGDVLLTQGDTALSADRMVIDLAAGTAQLDGRVRTILQGGAE